MSLLSNTKRRMGILSQSSNLLIDQLHLANEKEEKGRFIKLLKASKDIVNDEDFQDDEDYSGEEE